MWCDQQLTGRILEFSHVVIYQWIKAMGEGVEQMKRTATHIVELDELHSYVEHKSYYWVWIAIDQLGKRFLYAVTGTRGIVKGKQFWKAIKSPHIAQVMADAWEPYQHSVP